MAQVIMEGSTTDRARAQARSLEKGHNRPLGDETFPMQEPIFYVYMYTVGRRSMKTDHALLGRVEIPDCEGNRYKRFSIPIPEPFPQRVEDVFNTGRDPFDYHRGNSGAKRIAQDVCDPSNPTLNQTIEDYGKIDPYFAVQNGTNFAKHGVFWSLNEVPTEDELQRAEERRDRFWRYTIQQTDKFYSEDPKNVARLMSLGGFDEKDVRIALDYYGEERPYHKKFTAMMACPYCNKQIPQGVAFHSDEDGDTCVLDWKRTIAAGKKKREDVPVELRWWSEPKRKESPEQGA